MRLLDLLIVEESRNALLSVVALPGKLLARVPDVIKWGGEVKLQRRDLLAVDQLIRSAVAVFVSI